MYHKIKLIKYPQNRDEIITLILESIRRAIIDLINEFLTTG